MSSPDDPPDDPAAVVPNALHVLLLDLDRTVGWKLDLLRETAEAGAASPS
jgi:hypothetical protein